MERFPLIGGRYGVPAILIAALALVAIIWFGTAASLRAADREAIARANADLSNDALVFADRLSDHLSAIDQTLRILEHEWEADPASFDLPGWRERALVLSEGALTISITDARGIVRAATMPSMLGMDVSGQGFFRYHAALPADDGRSFIGPATRAADGSGWAMNISRRLDLADGTFAGVIAVSFDISELVRFYGEVELGKRGLLALLGASDLELRAVVGGGAVPGESVAGTPMGNALLRNPNGRWIGPSAPDEVERVHAFHRLPARDLDVVVAETVEEAVAPVAVWHREALAFGSLSALLVFALAGGLTANARAARRRVIELSADRASLAAAKAEADAKSARLKATLAAMSEGVMMMDADLRLVEWNDRFVEMTGLPPAMIRSGVTMQAMLRAQAELGELGAVDADEEVVLRLAAVLGMRDSISRERTRPNGTVIHMLRRRLPEGGYVTIFTDITAQRRHEETLREARLLAEASAESKSRFVAMVSHEIRQPLNTLLNSLTLLAGGPLSAPARRLVGTARQAGDALLGLMNDVLEMSKMEAGQLAVRPAGFSPRALLETVLGLFAEQAAVRGLRLELEVAASVPPRLRADPLRLRQILINLLSNAVKFAAPGRILLHAEIETSEVLPATQAWLRLTVSDPGPAIDPARRGLLFQPFAQLGDPEREIQSGTGLGLAVSRTLARLMGGDIGYEATEDGRNAFWVRVAVTSDAAETPPDIQPSPHQPRTRVLLVEDIRANQLVLATLLRREGHMVDIAESGEAAIIMVAAHPYDLVLMDVLMAGMTGIEAARRIRALEGAAGAVPICALTGNVVGEDRAGCEAAGMNAILDKPVEIEALRATIGRLMWNRRQPAADGAHEAAAADPPLRAARFAGLRNQLGAEVLDALALRAIEDLREGIALLRASLRAGDAQAIELQAHAMAGLAGNYALAALERRLHGIADAARSGGADRAAQAEGELDEEFKRAASALRQAVGIEAAA